MIIDSSAMLAILFREADFLIYAEKLRDAKISKMAAPIFLEANMAASRILGKRGADELQKLIALCKISIIPFSAREAEIAVEAFHRYGKGCGHPAQLNFGDCMSYATSKVEGMPLLFKGDDFRHTDVEVAI